MKQHLATFLAWLRITDAHDGQVSLTNIALMVVIAKVATNGQATLVDLGGLLFGLLASAGKKVLNARAIAATEQELQQYDASTQAQATDLGPVNDRIDQLTRTVDGLKNGLALKQAFGPK